jgi:FlaA1/EpsC-like NDP-sugar epimerase
LGGDIEIEITGLRPGEKLFEEVYESDDIVPTCHPRISKELGSGIDIHKIEMALALLHKSCSDDNATTVRSILKDVVCGYHPYEYYDPTSVREVIQTENIKTQRQSCIPKHA